MNSQVEVRFRTDPVSRTVEMYVYRPGYSNVNEIECLQLLSVDDARNPVMSWEPLPEGERSQPFLTFSDEVFDALEEAVVGDTKFHDSVLQGKVEVLEESLTKERERVDRLLP